MGRQRPMSKKNSNIKFKGDDHPRTHPKKKGKKKVLYAKPISKFPGIRGGGV